MSIDAEAYYTNAVGAYPPAIKTLAEGAPEFIDGYIEAREWVTAPKPDGLTPGFKELVYLVTDLAAGNIRGAHNHLKPALEHGVTPTALLEGITELISGGGLSTWGGGGHEIYTAFVELAGEQSAVRPFRRVVNGNDADGVSVILSDGQPEESAWPSRSGPKWVMWGSDVKPRLPLADAMPAFDGVFPPIEGARFIKAVFLPGHGLTPEGDPGSDAESVPMSVPNATAVLRPDGFMGMHSTESIDIGCIVSGSVTLVLETENVQLYPGDTFVLQGMQHRWINDSDEPVEFVAVMLGATTAPATPT